LIQEEPLAFIATTPNTNPRRPIINAEGKSPTSFKSPGGFSISRA